MNNSSDNSDYVAYMRPMIGNGMLKIPGACVAIENEAGEILFEKGYRHNKYRLVGGNADIGESVYDCACREVKEETGLDIKNLIPFGYYDHPSRITTLDNGHVIHSHTMLFLTRDYSGTLCAEPEEVIELKWINPLNMPDNVHPTTKLFVEALLEYKETGFFQFIMKDLMK